jgi:hypothetical protein
MAAPSSIKSLQESIKKAGLGESKQDSSTRIIVYTSEKDRVTVLKTIASAFGGMYSSTKYGPGWKSSQGSAKIGLFTVLVKPAAKAGTTGSVSNLDARVFTGDGKKGKFSYAGQDIDVVTFTSAKQIEKSMVEGAKKSQILGSEIAEQFDDFFTAKKFTWDPNLSPIMLNKLGVYAGEVLIGWAAFQKDKTKYMEASPFKGTVSKFHLPTDPAFTGVDSFVEMSDGSFYAVSSKFGVGAKASFFTNMLEKGIKKKSKLKNSVFKDICDICEQNNLEYKKSRDIVYTYGLKKILKLNLTSAIYNEIISDKKTVNVIKLNTAISKYPGVSPDIVKKLPRSASAFFNRTIAEQLNKDQASMDQIVEILQGKDYWQANLNIAEWIKGNVKFKFVKAAKAKVKFIGSKSAIDDVTSKQGWINYELSQ